MKLRIVKTKEKIWGKGAVHDANDILSNFPNGKAERRAPTEKEKLVRRVNENPKKLKKIAEGNFNKLDSREREQV